MGAPRVGAFSRRRHRTIEGDHEGRPYKIWIIEGRSSIRLRGACQNIENNPMQSTPGVLAKDSRAGKGALCAVPT
jgi:hypothetical protein